MEALLDFLNATGHLNNVNYEQIVVNVSQKLEPPEEPNIESSTELMAPSLPLLAILITLLLQKMGILWNVKKQLIKLISAHADGGPRSRVCIH